MTMMGGKELTQVKKFTFLEGIITQEGDCGRDIRTKIACAKDAFFARAADEVLQSDTEKAPCYFISLEYTTLWS